MLNNICEIKDKDFCVKYASNNIGRGGNAEIYDVTSISFQRKEITLDGNYVIKILKCKRGKPADRLKVEKTCLCKFQGTKGIAKLFYYNGHDISGLHWYVMKKYSNSLDFFTKSVTIDKKIDFLIELCSSILEMHNSGVVHRDLKPGNILCENGHPVICDLGLSLDKSNDLELTFTNEQLGSKGFIAPELYKDSKRFEKNIRFLLFTKSDSFSLTRIIACSILSSMSLGEVNDITEQLDCSLFENYCGKKGAQIVCGVLSDLYIKGTAYLYNERLSVAEILSYLGKVKKILTNSSDSDELSFLMSYILRRINFKIW